MYVVRKRIKLSPEKAIFIFVKNILPPTGNIYGFCGCVCGILWFLWLILWSELWFSVYAAAMMSAIYEENKDEDGFLYMTYSGENTFGLVFWNNPWLVTIWIVLPKIDQCEEVSLIVNSLVWCFLCKVYYVYWNLFENCRVSISSKLHKFKGMFFVHTVDPWPACPIGVIQFVVYIIKE